MKQKMVMCLLAGVLVLGIGGCGTQEVEVPEVENVETAEEEPVPEETAEEEGDEQEKADAASGWLQWVSKCWFVGNSQRVFTNRR